MSELSDHLFKLLSISSVIITNMIVFIEEFFYVINILIFQYLLVLLNDFANSILIHFDTNTENLGIKLFLIVSNKYSQLKYAAIDLYEKNPTIKKNIDNISVFLKESYKKFHGIKSEPISPLWISIFTLNEKFQSTETYTIIENSVNEILLKNFKSFIEENTVENSNIENLYTFKTPAYILCNITNRFEKEDVKYIVEPSDVKFLNIEYLHKDMIEPIEIKIDKNYFQVGNELLSKSFILRHNQYQNNFFMYGDDYVVKVMDDKINEFTLNSDQYVLLEKNEYKIMTI
jgi:hypothetical protein